MLVQHGYRAANCTRDDLFPTQDLSPGIIGPRSQKRQRIGPKEASDRNRFRPGGFLSQIQEALMHDSIHQARWLLAPLFVIAFGFPAIGFLIG